MVALMGPINFVIAIFIKKSPSYSRDFMHSDKITRKHFRIHHVMIFTHHTDAETTFADINNHILL